MADYQAFLPEILEQEGGFVDNPADPGGATKYGVTLRTLSAHRGEACTVDDVRNLSQDEAESILCAMYCNVVRAADLPAGVDLCVSDFAVNSGPARAAEALQRAAGATVDGSVGPETLRDVAAVPAADIIQAVSAARMTLLRSLSTWAYFGEGWTRRVTEVQGRSLVMAASSASSTIVPPPEVTTATQPTADQLDDAYNHPQP